jgi:hypothetical protein
MIAWYWYFIGILALFFIAIGIEWIIDFWFSWPFEE